MARARVTAVDDRTTLDGAREHGRAAARAMPADVLALVVLWWPDAPHRLGEIALLPGEQLLGRGGARPEDGAPRVRLHRQRPGSHEPTGAIESLRISRAQLKLRPEGDEIALTSLGRSALRIDGGAPVLEGRVGVGGTILVGEDLLLGVVRRPEAMSALASFPRGSFGAFGALDALGYVGESPAAWRLREAVAFAASAEGHVLVRGESGVGKELAARAIHAMSRRSAGPFISRNAATFPSTLVDAELFGSARDYPNAGSPERLGLVGEAHGGTLLLDEIGELAPALQAHLLRVLDRGGEYQRLGDARARRSDLRIVGATNRPLTALKHDFAARFTLRVDLPPLGDRREDIPLLVVRTLERAVATHADVARSLAPDGALDHRRVDPLLVDHLVRRSYDHHVRELEELLWRALGGRGADGLSLESIVGARDARPESSVGSGAEPTRAEVEASLARHQGNVTAASRDLGVKNRFALYRLMRKLGIAPTE